MKPAIEVHNLSKSFKYFAERPTTLKSALVDLFRGQSWFGSLQEIEVLKNINFTINEGDFVGIMGKNGAGKSTILKLIAGIYAPTSGKLVTHAPIAPMIELGAGFTPDLSGYENIFLNASILGFGRGATMETIDSIVEFSELGELIHMPVAKYSSGMLVRLGFAIASHLSSPILLIDEVLAVGDLGFQNKCLGRIHKLHKEGRTIVLVTHSPDQVLQNCNRCIILGRHRVLFDGHPRQGVECYRAETLNSEVTT